MTSFIDNIAGIVCLPLGILLLLNAVGLTKITTLFGLSTLLLGALAICALQAANLVSTHISGDWIILSYVVHILLLFPAAIYFIGLLTPLSAALAAGLPMMMGCFIISEGLYSFFF